MIFEVQLPGSLKSQKAGTLVQRREFISQGWDDWAMPSNSCGSFQNVCSRYPLIAAPGKSPSKKVAKNTQSHNSEKRLRTKLIDTIILYKFSYRNKSAVRSS